MSRTWTTSVRWSLSDYRTSLADTSTVSTFDMAEDVVFDFIITVPNYPRHVVGRASSSSSTAATVYVPRPLLRPAYHHSPSTSRWCSNTSEGRAGHRSALRQQIHLGIVIKDRKVIEWRDYLTLCGSSPPSRYATVIKTPTNQNDPMQIASGMTGA